MDVKYLKTLLSQPTAPFKERYVMACVEEALDSANVPYFYDDHGNMVIGVGDKGSYKKLLSQKSRVPLRVMMAHTDHPGFHGSRWVDDSTLAIKWLGGSPKKYLHNAQVWLADDHQVYGHARLKQVVLASHGFSIDTAHVKIPKSLVGTVRRVSAKRLFGGFSFSSDCNRKGSLLYTRAADDLVGVYCIVETALRLFEGSKRKRKTSFVGLLTRGEEVGFVGAIAHFKSFAYQAMKRPLVCVSLEASRTLPGAEIGKGPVVRLGDRRTVFSANPLQALTNLAEQHIKDEYQRRIMDGGSCEASATTMLGLPTVGISIPLGNYHNEGYEGGPDCRGDRGSAPEFVHIKDIERMLSLCVAIAEDDQVWDHPWDAHWQRLEKNFAKMKKYL